MILVVGGIITGIQGFWVVGKNCFSISNAFQDMFCRHFLASRSAFTACLVMPEILKLIIGLFMISYGIYIFVTRKLPIFLSNMRPANGVIGFIGGFLEWSVSLSGAVPSIWLSLHNWPKAEIRICSAGF